MGLGYTHGLYFRFGQPKDSQRILALHPEGSSAEVRRSLPISLLVRPDVLVRGGLAYKKLGEPQNPPKGAAVFFWRDGQVVEVHKAGPTAADEDKLTAKVASIFNGQKDLLSNSDIKTAIESGTPILIADQVEWEHGIAKPLLDDIEESRLAQFRKAGNGAVKEWSGEALSFKVTNPRSQHFIETYGAKLVTAITDETRDGLRKMLSTAYREGLSVDQTAALIRGSIGVTGRQAIALRRFAENAYGNLPAEIAERRIARYNEKLINYRARMIARTELIRASNQGELEGWRQLQDEGIFARTGTKKFWMIAYDERTCDICIGLDGQGVELKEPFASGDDAPPAHPHCRCTIYLVPEDMPRLQSMIPESERKKLEDRGLKLQPAPTKEDLQWSWEKPTPGASTVSEVLGVGGGKGGEVAARAYERALGTAEWEIRTAPIEHVVVVDERGKVLTHLKGGRDSCAIPPADMAKLRGATLTHNHPGWQYNAEWDKYGQSFSIDDIKLARKAGTKEIRAVGKDRTYVMGSQNLGSIKDLEQEIALAEKKVQAIDVPTFVGEQRAVRMQEANRSYWHRVWEELAKKFNLDYRVEFHEA